LKYTDSDADFKLSNLTSVTLTNLTVGERIVFRTLEELEVLETEHLWLRLLAIRCGFRFPPDEEISVIDRELALLGTTGGKKAPRPRSINSLIKAIKRSRRATIERQSAPDSNIIVTLSRADMEAKRGRPYIYKPLYLKVIEDVISSCPPGTPDWLERQEVRAAVEEFRKIKRIQLVESSSREDSSTSSLKRSVTSLHKGIMMEMSLYMDNLGLGMTSGLNRWGHFMRERLDQTDPEVREKFLEGLQRVVDSLAESYKPQNL